MYKSTGKQNYNNIKRKLTALFLSAVFALLLCAVITLQQAEAAFTLSPNAPAYAKEFYAKCEGQQWFIEEVERLLNANQRTINTLESNSELNIIETIGLSDRNISGSIPSAISELTKLRYIFLSGNKLTGTIPAGLFSLPLLQNIDLSGNLYSSAIPPEFGTMPSLTVLSLRGNKFTGTIPDTVLSNASITYLDVSSNKLTGQVPSSFTQMASLEYLSLSDNPWSESAFPDLSCLTNLKVLSMWKCNIKDELPATLFTLTKLQILDLAINSLHGEIPAELNNFTELQLLALGSNALEGVIPEISALTNLKIVDIAENKLRGIIPDILLSVDKVYAQKNYLTGDNLLQIDNNADNFCDGAQNAQYRLISTRSPLTISTTARTNLMQYLQNKPLRNSPVKPLLPADCYEIRIENDPDGLVEVEITADGIFVIANDVITKSDPVKIIIWIKDNEGSAYSTVEILLTTESTETPSTGGGSGSTSQDEEQKAETIVHEPYYSRL